MQSRYESASELCLQALREAPGAPEFLLLLALSDEGRGDVRGARSRLESALVGSPNKVECRYQLGRLLLMDGHVAGAREQFHQVLHQDYNHAPSYTALARLDHADGQLTLSLERLRTALRADPEHVPALTTLASVLLDQGELESAREEASQAIHIAPEEPSAHLALGRVLLAQGYLSFAEQCLANAADLDPNNPRVHLAMAMLLQKLGRHGDALKALAAAERTGAAGPTLLRARALSFHRIGELSSARAAHDQLIGSAATTTEQLLEYVDILVSLGDRQGLVGLPERIHTDEPAFDVWVKSRLALVDGALQVAVDMLRSTFDLAGPDLASRAGLLLAETLLRQDKTEDGLQQLELLSPTVGQRPELAQPIARLAYGAGALEFAVSILEPVVDHAALDEHAQALAAAMLSDLYDKSGRYEKAAVLFKRSAWQATYLGQAQSSEDAGDAGQGAFATAPASAGCDDSRRPVFIAGWPCSGRDLVLVALSRSGLRPLPLADWPMRRQQLGLSSERAVQENLNDTELHLRRRRYFRGLAGNRDVLESGVVHPRDLPLLARLFPGSAVVLPRAEERYAALQWRLFGYRQVPTMREFWRQEQLQLEVMRPHLPVAFVDLPLAELLNDSEEVLSKLFERLRLPWDSVINQSIQEIIALRGYRPPMHHSNYPDEAL